MRAIAVNSVNSVQNDSVDYTPQLKLLMQPAGLVSFKGLSQLAGVSNKQIRKLRQGHIGQMQVATVQKLAETLQVSFVELVSTFSEISVTLAPSSQSPNPSDIADLQQEYDRLQRQLNQQKEILGQEFQQSSLQVLESLLLQLPTAAYAAQQNPQLSAVKLLPLLRPIDTLLQQWEIEAIAQVGAEIPYDPQQHQLMEGVAATGDRVRVRYVGYRQGDRLLYRAKVSLAV
ncbi:nucleotide exchange factor GrpE [Leptolyngbyaceae cyanobacterium UHCC 1019]